MNLQLDGKNQEIERLSNLYSKLNESYSLLLNKRTDLDDSNVQHLQLKLQDQQQVIMELQQKLYNSEQAHLAFTIARFFKKLHYKNNFIIHLFSVF